MEGRKTPALCAICVVLVAEINLRKENLTKLLPCGDCGKIFVFARYCLRRGRSLVDLGCGNFFSHKIPT